MIVIYTKNGNLSCRSVIRWFQKNKISYKERRIYTNCPLSKIELEEILLLAPNGFDDIISFRSKTYNQFKYNFDNFSYKEALELIVTNSNILRFPIIIDRERRKMGVGFNGEEIRCFLPRHYKTGTRKDYQKGLEYYF